MKVQDIMTDSPSRCTPNATLAEAAEVMWTADCGVLPVVEDGRLVGILTDRDICIALGTRNKTASELTVGELETKDVVTCLPEDEVHTAMELMRRAKVRRLPVVDRHGKLKGILALNDLVLRTSHARSELTYEQVLNTMKAICEHRAHKPETVPAAAVSL